MATVLYDTEEQCFVDRVSCIAYREISNKMIARIEDSFISRECIFEKL